MEEKFRFCGMVLMYSFLYSKIGSLFSLMRSLKRRAESFEKGISGLAVILALVIASAGSLILVSSSPTFREIGVSDNNENKTDDNYAQHVSSDKAVDNLDENVSDEEDGEKKDSYENFEILLGNINAGEKTIVDLGSDDNFLKNIEITTSENISELKIYLEKTNNPKEYLSPSEGEVFKYFDIHSDVSDNSVENVSITFSVPINWVEKNNLEKEISLLKYQDGWKKLSTRFVEENENRYYFKAKTSGFHNFATAYLKKEQNLTPIKKSEEESRPSASSGLGRFRDFSTLEGVPRA